MDEPVPVGPDVDDRVLEAMNALLMARSMMVPGVDQDVDSARFCLDVAFKALDLLLQEEE